MEKITSVPKVGVTQLSKSNSEVCMILYYINFLLQNYGTKKMKTYKVQFEDKTFTS